MTDRFDINWVNSGTSKNPAPYPSGGDINMSHCATPYCIQWHLSLKPGLYCVRCRACGADTLINITGDGDIRLACKTGGTVVYPTFAFGVKPTPYRR